MNDTFQLLADTAAEALNHYQTYGSEQRFMNGGYNGPYFDIETPIRNTSHWLVSLSVLYAETGRQAFHDLAVDLCDFLLKPGIYEKQSVLVHRQKSGKDWSNGVIGHAWAIEALVVAGQLLNKKEAFERAQQLANAFSFSSSAKAWIKTDPANCKKRVDYTLNHQIWYAAAISMLDDVSRDTEVSAFLDTLNNGAMRIRKNGVLAHLLYTNTLKGWALRGRYKLSELKNWCTVTHKETGYHLYNLYPLARLKCHFPEHSIFQSRVLKTALDTAFSKDFVNALDDNKYAYPYNAPAFDYPLIANVFGYNTEIVDKTWQRQFDKTYDAGSKSFSKNCPDPLTLNARIYEWFLNIYYDKYHLRAR